MKAYFFLFLLCLGFIYNVKAQNNTEKKQVSDFEISIEHSASGTFTLLCNKGCAWKKLSFKDGNPAKVYHVSEFGMDEEPNNSPFSFSLQCRKEEIILTSFKGTTWKFLKFPCLKENRPQIINGYGMK